MKESVRIGAGAGYSGDRIDPAVELAEKADLDYLVFECLAERTIALAQLRKLEDRGGGYDPLLEERMRQVLPAALENGTCLVTNMGQANPAAAAERTAEIADELGLRGLRVAAVLGDDVLDTILAETEGGTGRVIETGEPVAAYRDRLVSANAYLGAEAIAQALEHEPDVVITGRVADPSLFVAPMMHEFGWSATDYATLGKGTVMGHLLECAGQLTGGYFADPESKPVPGMARLGFPYAVVERSGDGMVTKLPDSGGQISLANCKEQLLYEVGNPAQYITPDVAADFTGVELQIQDKDTVRVAGATGHERTDTLKAALGIRDGFLGEGQISYAGPKALERAHLAAQIVEERLAKVHRIEPVELRTDYIGVNSTFRGPASAIDPAEVRLRLAAKTKTRSEAELVAREVQTLYTNGPAGGGGARKHIEEVIGVVSTLLSRERISFNVRLFTASG